MLKMYVFLTSPVGHDPFIAAGAAAADRVRQALPDVAGYTQTRTLGEQIDAQAAPPNYTGMAEFWFADTGGALAAAENAAALQPLWRDGTVASAVVVGQERVVMRLPEHHRGGFIKGVFPFRRKKQMPVADFQHYWWHSHGPIAALTEGAVFYVQCHPLPDCYRNGSPAFDGVTELHWPDVAAARAAMGSRQMREDQAGDAANFAEPGSVLLFLAEEERVIPA
jgi:uncharacterized protein (TIGR02118 family)